MGKNTGWWTFSDKIDCHVYAKIQTLLSNTKTRPKIQHKTVHKCAQPCDNSKSCFCKISSEVILKFTVYCYAFLVKWFCCLLSFYRSMHQQVQLTEIMMMLDDMVRLQQMEWSGNDFVMLVLYLFNWYSINLKFFMRYLCSQPFNWGAGDYTFGKYGRCIEGLLIIPATTSFSTIPVMWKVRMYLVSWSIKRGT